jgi:flagellar biogenesis protein FliO
MADDFQRLAWALPLVLVVAGISAWLLRYLGGVRRSAPTERRLRLLESRTIGKATTVHLVEADRRAFVVIESDEGAVRHSLLQLEQVPAASGETDGLPWMRRMSRKSRA